jgi:lauroyl/myristoyl acyltransferase
VLENLAQIAAAGHPGLADSKARGRAARSMFESHHRGWLEYLGRPKASAMPHASAFRISGTEFLYRAIAGGRGAILTMPHLGNWEIAGIGLTRLGLRMHTVTGVQLHPLLARQVRALKEREGIRVSTPEDGFAPLVSALRGGEIVALLVDGDVYSRSLPANFFGRRVAFPAGPAILARRARVPILHGHAVRGAGGEHAFSFDGLDEPDYALPLREDLSRLTAGVARSQERNIAAHVNQWCIFRPIWGIDAA